MQPRSLRLLLLVLLYAACGKIVGAQLPPEVQKQIWSAEWITSSNGSQRDPVVLHFRKTLDLASPPQHFFVRVSADNQFLFFVNGHYVGSGPAHADLGHWRYERYDIGPFLREGRNLLAATVWNFGVLTPLAQISDRTGFLVQGETSSEEVADTNRTWQVEVENGVQILPIPDSMRRRYYVAEPGERIDAAKLDWDWNVGDHQSTGLWQFVDTIGHATPHGSILQNDNWQLVEDPLPPMQLVLSPGGHVVRSSGVSDFTDFPSGPLSLEPHTKASILLDNGTLTTAFPELRVSGGSGATIRLTYAEALFDEKGEKGNRNDATGKHIDGVFDEFLLDGTNRTFPTLGWKTWRYLQLDIENAEQPLVVQGFQSRYTAYPFEELGHFRSDDSSLTPIWEIGWRTARLDAHDTYMDTPYYERMQYVGDTRIQALISYTVAGDDRLARQAIQAFSDSRIPDGLTRSRYPSSVRQIIPPFSLLWIGMVHDFWMYRDDPDFVRAQLPGTRSVLNWFLGRQRTDGFLGQISWWPFLDWGSDFSFGSAPQDQEGRSAPLTLQFIEALRDAAEMETRLGDKSIGTLYLAAAERAAESVRKLCWNPRYGLLADTPDQKHFSQHTNILGVWLDVIPSGEQRRVLTRILSKSDAGYSTPDLVPELTEATYYFRFYLARALDHAGLGDQYLRLLGPWHKMVALGLTTWAEQPEPTRSDSHAWSAHPNYDFLTIVAGIRPTNPGFTTVAVAPHLGMLKHVWATFPSPQGIIEVEYRVEDKAVEISVKLPRGMSGDFLWEGTKTTIREGPQHLSFPLNKTH